MKNFNMGFAVIDGTGFDLSSASSQTVNGIHNQLDTAYNSGMPIVLCGANYNSTPISPLFIYVYKSGTSYVVDGKYTITTSDVITRN